MTDQQIHVNVTSGTGEILRIVATILLFGGAGAVAWSVAQGEHAEIAATGFSMMLVMIIKLMYSRGMIRVPAGGGGEEFTATKTMLTQVSDEYKRWLAGTSMPAMVVIAMGYAVGFLILRAGVAAAMNVFQNLYVAGGVAAMVGALVVFPSLVPSMIASLKNKGVVTEQPEPAQQVASQRVEQAPATPVAAPAPRTEAAPQPVAQPSPAPAPQRRVVRRVVKKEN